VPSAEQRPGPATIELDFSTLPSRSPLPYRCMSLDFYNGETRQFKNSSSRSDSDSDSLVCLPRIACHGDHYYNNVVDCLQ
jgi:hypothetical protein